ncbi:MAG: CBS domain-containing protein [candidate division NC10 bacterium]
MKVRDIMTISCITAPETMPVLEARQLMLEKRIRHLLVTDGPKLLGIVTDRDIRLNLPSPATSLSVWEINYLLARMTLSSVMTKNVVVVESGREATEAAQVMLDHKIGALPVVDRGHLVGIITETDLLRAFVKSG